MKRKRDTDEQIECVLPKPRRGHPDRRGLPQVTTG